MIGAIILAAGSGKRMQAACNKQYLKLDGKMVLSHTLSAFARHPDISGIVLVIRPEDADQAQMAIAEAGCHEHICAIVNGGAERQDSVRLALAEVPKGWRQVLIHDGARPLVSQSLLSRLVAASREDAGVIPVLAVKDTVKRLTPEGLVAETLPRSVLALAQTPQMFPTALICQAHDEALKRNLAVTDDASLFEALALPVHAIAGEASNLKVTVPEDLPLAQWYLTGRKESQDACRNRI